MSLRLAVPGVLVALFASIASAQPAPVATDTVAVIVTPAIAAVVTPTIAHVDTQSIETPFVGTFTMSGGVKGEITVSRRDESLTLSGNANGITFIQVSPVDGPRTWRIELGSTSGGITNNLGGANNGTATSTRILVVTDAGKGALSGTFEFKNKKTAVAFARKKEVLVIYGTYENGMKVFGQECQAYYKGKGWKVTMIPGDWGGAVSTLLGAEESGHPFCRVVVVSHGGWDGPMMREGLYTQISGTYHAESFWDLMRAIKRGTTLDAKLIFSSCHSGGSNRYETWRQDYRYSDSVAAASGRLAYGVNGSTSTEWSRQLCMFAEGEGPARQESRVSGPGGGKTVMPGGSLVAPPPINNQPLGTTP